jgi:hypothetical protein
LRASCTRVQKRPPAQAGQSRASGEEAVENGEHHEDHDAGHKTTKEQTK